MEKPIIHEPIKYLDSLITIIDSSEAENFVDTSIVLNPAIYLYDPKSGKHLGYNFFLLKEALEYYSGSKEYYNIEKGIIEHFQKFGKDIDTLFEQELKVSESVYKELSEAVNNQEYMMRSNCRKIQELQKNKKIYRHHVKKDNTTGRFRNTTEHEYVNAPHHARVPNVKKRNHTLNNIILIERGIVQDVKDHSKPYMEKLLVDKFRNEELHDDIFDAVTEAFAIYKLNSKDRFCKDHSCSSDHKILTEMILYSHLEGKKVRFFTADKDFLGIAERLRNKRLNSDIRCDVDIIKRIDRRPETVPYFTIQAKITYDDRFKVE